MNEAEKLKWACPEAYLDIESPIGDVWHEHDDDDDDNDGDGGCWWVMIGCWWIDTNM